MAKKNKNRIDFSQMSELKQNPFAQLGSQFGIQASDDTPSPAPAAQPASTNEQPMLTLRKEKRKSGKLVTCILHLQSGHKDVLSKLKKKLAVGGTVSGDVVELQGDVRERAAQHLIAMGYKIRTSAS